MARASSHLGRLPPSRTTTPMHAIVGDAMRPTELQYSSPEFSRCIVSLPSSSRHRWPQVPKSSRGFLAMRTALSVAISQARKLLTICL